MAIRALSVLQRMGIVVAIALAFLFGLASTVYLSLRSPEVTVPDVVGKDRFEAEHVLGGAGLNFRIRATRPSGQLKPDTVLFQLPRAGEVIKAGQTVAMDVSRSAKEGEVAESVAPEKKSDEDKAAEIRNENESAKSNANENKPKRDKKANKNANENANANTTTANRNVNSNRAGANANSNTGINPTAAPSPTANGTGGSNNANSNRSPTQNENPRPPERVPTPPGYK